MTVRTVSDVLANCMSTDQHRMILQCVIEDIGEDGVFRVATDTFKMAVLKMPGGGNKNPSIRILYPDWAAMSLAEAKYPNWRKVIPADAARPAVIPIDAFVRALKSVGVVARDNACRVRLKFEGALLTVSGKSDAIGDVSCVIQLAEAFEGEPLEIAFNYSWLVDILPVKRAAAFKNCILSLIASSKPATMTYAHDGDFAALSVTIMPMALA